MAGSGPGDLQDLCQEFLDACVESLDTIPTFEPGLGGAPARSFISPGQPQYDCCPDGQLTVHAAAVSSDPIQPAKNEWRKNLVTLVATSLRCVPVASDQGGPAPIADVQAAAEQVNADGWALWNHIFNLVAADQLFTKCGTVRWDGLRSIAPSGGCGGFLLTLTVEYDGYQEVISS